MSTITVFTPTYNRDYCLGNVYESLKRQTCFDFEWLIIDDGSTDQTNSIVQKWVNEAPFKVRYLYKENGGMHTAYNLAYENISTELCMNVDSDDFLTDTAIEDILALWEKIKSPDIGGIYALDAFPDGTIIGKPFPDDLKFFSGWGYKRIYYSVGKRNKVFVNKGDKKFVGVTKIIKQYPPIPVFRNEKYYTLYYKQHYIERDYQIAILNKPVCCVEYRNDGSSKNMFKQYVMNCEGFRDERRFIMKNSPSRIMKVEEAIHYVAESIIARDYRFLHSTTNLPATLVALVPGFLLYLIIIWRNKL